VRSEDVILYTIESLASDLATTIYIDGDYKHALCLLCEFRRIVEALLTLREMRSDCLVQPLRR